MSCKKRRALALLFLQLCEFKSPNRLCGGMRREDADVRILHDRHTFFSIGYAAPGFERYEREMIDGRAPDCQNVGIGALYGYGATGTAIVKEGALSVIFDDARMFERFIEAV